MHFQGLDCEFADDGLDGSSSMSARRTQRLERDSFLCRCPYRVRAVSCPVGGVLEEGHSFCLRAFLSFDDIELNLIALFQRFESIHLDCRVVDEYVRPVFTSDESVALGVLEPFNYSFELCHEFLPSLPGISILRAS